MRHKKLPLFFLGILIIGLITGLFIQINQVKADSTYEWIQNGGFEDVGGNQISNPSFGSGILTPWESNTEIQTSGRTDAHSGYCLYSSGYVYQNITGSLISDISEFSFWWYNNAQEGAYNVRVTIYWTNNTYSQVNKAVTCYYGGIFHWVQVICTSDFGSTGIINRIKVDAVEKSGFVDDFILMDISGGGQSDFNASTTPWFSAEASDFQGINVAGIAHSGIACVYDGYTDYWQSIIQNINFLDSNTVTNLTCYVSGSSVPRNIKLKMNVIYSDRSFSTKTVIVTSNNEYDWKFMNFTDIILPNKIIIQIQFVLPEQTDYYVHVDDISLVASIPVTQTRFSYTLTPLPINQTGFTFTVYQKTTYIFNGFLYDLTGNPTENGTYILITSKGSQSGNIISGVFSFVLTQRLGIADFQESIIIQINNTLTIQLTAIWKFIGSDGFEDDGNLPNTNVPVSTFITFLIYTILLFAFPFVFTIYAVQKAPQINPLFVFLIGFNIMALIGMISTLISLWVLIVMMIIDVVYALYSFEHRGGI